ncbi:23S rRNA methyltransferase (fragment) [Pseudomonas sp. 8AS]
MWPQYEWCELADQARVEYLGELTPDLAGRVLRPGGECLIKIARGEGFDARRKRVREACDEVRVRKALSSRDRSREQYLLARVFRGG